MIAGVRRLPPFLPLFSVLVCAVVAAEAATAPTSVGSRTPAIERGADLRLAEAVLDTDALKQAVDAALLEKASPDDGLRALTAPDTPVIAKSGAVGATRPGVTVWTGFRLSERTRIDQIMTYHYGARKTPGTIALKRDDGEVFGPWQARGAVGQGDVPNAYWWVRPSLVLEAGRYRVIDSDPATWSWEDVTRGAGIFTVWGRVER